jgi:hypothetical protein
MQVDVVVVEDILTGINLFLFDVNSLGESYLAVLNSPTVTSLVGDVAAECLAKRC